MALSASSKHEAQRFEQAGVDVVFIPYADAAAEAAERLAPTKNEAARATKPVGEI